MKWTDKGHQYDAAYQRMSEIEEWYLFGAGDYGKLFLPIIKKECRVLGFIDNDERKQAEGCMGYPVYPAEKIRSLSKRQGVLLTISQFSRASARQLLHEMELKEHEDFFLFEEFLSVYFVYRYDKVYLSSISFLPSTVCNLNCRHCLNFNPFAKKFYQRELDALIRDVDLFFAKVDRVMIFHLSGGEPFLYPKTAEIIRYISQTYGQRIDAFRMPTNGTIVPSEELRQTLAESRIEVTVDDYRETAPKYADQFKLLLKRFDEYGVRYVVNKAEAWVDLAPERTDYSDHCEAWLERHFDRCCQTWHELRGGKLYCCNYAAYAVVAGIAGEEDLEETFDLAAGHGDFKKELVEFRLGYTTKGYTNFCRKCRGFTPENADAVTPAAQIGRGIDLTAAGSDE